MIFYTIQLKKLTELKDEVIGLKGCEWKEYGKGNAKTGLSLAVQVNSSFKVSNPYKDLN